jgi:hypothetical protein
MPRRPNFIRTRPVVVKVLITPAIAQRLLDDRAPNRSLRARVVSAYARDMVARRWKDNGETIKLDRTGRLLDGQHRLMAVVECGIAHEFYLALGLDMDAMTTVDTGVRRRFADILRMMNVTNATNAAAAVRMVWDYEGGQTFLNFGTFSTQEGLAILDRFPQIPENVSRIHTHGFDKLRARSVLTFGLTMTQRLDPAASEMFFQQLREGTGLEDTDPAYHLRERLTAVGVKPGGVYDRFYRVAVFIKAWNAHVRGCPIRCLRHGTTETFPRFDPPIPGLRNPE